MAKNGKWDTKSGTHLTSVCRKCLNIRTYLLRALPLQGRCREFESLNAHSSETLVY